MIKAVLAVLITLSACAERPTTVSLQGGNPPTFVLSGSGNLVRLYISEAVTPNSDQHRALKPLWVIMPSDLGSSGLEGIPLESVGKVTYGSLPSGCRQVIPSDGQPPAELSPGKQYYFHVATVDAAHASGYFSIKDGRAVAVEIQGHCVYERNGEQIDGPCPNH